MTIFQRSTHISLKYIQRRKRIIIILSCILFPVSNSILTICVVAFRSRWLLWYMTASWHGEISHSWWRHQMETFSALLAICAGNSSVPVNSLHKGQWRGALMFSLICVWINGWVNNHEAGDLRRYHVYYNVIVMLFAFCSPLTEVQHCRNLVLSFVNLSYWVVEQSIVSMLLILSSNHVSAIRGLDTTLVYR